MSVQGGSTSRMYIHRRFVVRFLIVLLVALSLASFVSIGLGLGLNTQNGGQEDSGTPTRLADTNPFYVLIVGSDSLAGTALYTGGVGSQAAAQGPQADAIVLARIDPEACTVTLVTVPSNTVLADSDQLLRDTLEPDGCSQTVRTVERITGVSIRYWFLMDFSSFEAFMSQVGSVKADVPVAMTVQDPLTAKATTVPSGKGVQLDEAEVLAYVRATDPYVVDADPHRQLNVRSVISDIVFKVLDLDDDAVRKVLGVFEEEVETNIDNGTLISLVTRFLDEREWVQVFSCTGPYLASSINDAGEPVVGQQVVAWRELMSVVDSGEDPAQVLPQYAFQGSEADYAKPEKPESSSTAVSGKASSSSKAGSSSSSAASSGAASSASGKD